MRVMLGIFGLLLAVAVAAAEPVIDGASAPQWIPCVGWVQKRPAKFDVTADNEGVLFTAEGKGAEMPWLINLRDSGFSGDERYLFIRYKATGLATATGGYFLHGEEGTVGGRLYAAADEVRADGRWHILAVDLAAVEPLETTHSLAIKVIVDSSGCARLTVDRIWFGNDLAPDAQLAARPKPAPQKVLAVDWPAADRIAPQQSWIRTPAEHFAVHREGGAAVFTVADAGKGMRWLISLPRPIDLGTTPYLSFRYRATGDLDGTTYVVWLGGHPTGTGGRSTIPLSASEIQADGVWHQVVLKVGSPLTATQLAVGLDCTGRAAVLSIDNVHFSSRPRRWSVAESLPCQSRNAAWSDGADGFTAQPLRIRGGRPSACFLPRAGLADWFRGPHVTIAGVPFEAPTDAQQIQQSGTDNFATLSFDLPADSREVYLLTVSTAPSSEPWGIDGQRPRRQEMLDVPEKVFYEIRYETGKPDRVLPLDLESGRWGMQRRLSVNVVHPDPQRRATELVLHDRMQTAGFAIVAATVRRDAPRIAEPNWDHLAPLFRPTDQAALGARRSPERAKVCGAFAKSNAVLPPDPLASAVHSGLLQAAFDTSHGLAWSHLSIAGWNDALSCARCPVFEVSVAGMTLDPSDWSLGTLSRVNAGVSYHLRHAKLPLEAHVECSPGSFHDICMRMTLTNTGPMPLTATLRFPVLRDVQLGSAAGTWYLFGKRGGLINSAPVRLREPLGERHPLQMDGFFNAQTGLALACLTHDRDAQHHFINVAKTDRGGQWQPEYVQRDLPAGASFTTTEAALVLAEGDWRAIFGAYKDWLRTWFRPAALRKPWFERVFALASGNAHYDAVASPRERGAVQPVVDLMLKHIGLCDYAHLFGWSASRRYGDWGDYDHYDETVGGEAYFRDNIRRVQESGVAVSLYLDGYVSSGKGSSAGGHAREWAMQRPDGSPQYVPAYDAYNECPYQRGWQDYLSGVYRRVQQELRPKIMYIDEYGATDGRWVCAAADHGHNRYEIPYAGEVAMLRRIREAVGPDVALYTEYPPAEVSRQWLDGSITYQALWSADQEPLAPHFIDLPRFAFPDFKQFHIIYYVTTRAGNWWLLKFPFFNGEVYRVGVPGLPSMDPPSLAFLKRAIEVQCAHREAFASHNVEPLVPTEAVGVFANLFRGPRESVWTLYNANGRSVDRPVLRVRHVAGATYADAWRAAPLAPEIREGFALIPCELEPKGIGCVLQRLPDSAVGPAVSSVK